MKKITSVHLVSKYYVEKYYEFLLQAFVREFCDVSPRQIVEEKALKEKFSPKEQTFFRKIVENGFQKNNPYKKLLRPPDLRKTNVLEIIDYIVREGYPPMNPFVIWVYKKLRVPWNPLHWFKSIVGDIAPRDILAIRKELSSIKRDYVLPPTLEFYYRVGTGRERVRVLPEEGIEKSLQNHSKGIAKYKGFDPVDYLHLDHYYGLFNREDMTIVKTFYETLLRHRKFLPKRSTALIVGNGPVPDDAQTLAMIPEISTIIPADFDPRNIEIMSAHSGNRNPLITYKIRPGEEHADFQYYLFEQFTGMRYGFFAVREIMAVKTKDPVHIDISQKNPLDVAHNSFTTKNLRADLVVVPFCPESITNNFKVYESYVANITNLVQSGKYLCMLALKNAKFYMVGNKKLKAFPVNEQILHEVLRKNGFIDIEITTVRYTGQKPEGRGFQDSMIVWARRE